MNGWMFGENRGKIENSDANLNGFQLRPIRKPRSPISLSASNVAEGDKALQALQWSLNTLASNDINKRLWHASILHTFTWYDVLSAHPIHPSVHPCSLFDILKLGVPQLSSPTTCIPYSSPVACIESQLRWQNARNGEEPSSSPAQQPLWHERLKWSMISNRSMAQYLIYMCHSVHCGHICDNVWPYATAVIKWYIYNYRICDHNHMIICANT